MSEINFDNFKCRCSAINKMLASSRSNPVLTEKQAVRLDELEKKDKLSPTMQAEMTELLQKKENGKKIILSDTCITYLMEEYAWVTQRMVRITKELEVMPMEKGKIVEPESVSLLCIVDGVLYNHNVERIRIYNDYLSGEVDAWLGNSIMEAEVVPDIKSVWDYPTFLCKIHEVCSNDNDWQVKGYINITGAKSGFIADCLIDTPDYIVEKLKWQLLVKTHAATEESPEFLEKWLPLEHSMKFNHIPHHQRVNKKPIEPMTAFQQDQVYDRVKVCREWLNNFHETYQKLNK